MVDLPFQLPDNLLMLGRSIGILSGICTGLDPEFNIWGTISPYAAKLVSEEGGTTAKAVLAEVGKLARIALALPGRADRVLAVAERGELTIQTPLLNLRVRPLERTLNRTNRLLVFAALLIAGAIVMATDITLGRWLMGGSIVPLLWAMAPRRRAHSR